MTHPDLVSRDDWLKARKALLREEKAFTRERDRLAAARRALPMVLIEKDYVFDTENGKKSLADLFGPNRQLVVYHFMFGETWEEGCRMGWTFDWASTAGNGFGVDFRVTFPGKADPSGEGYNYSGELDGEEMPGISTFLKLDDGRVAHSYSTYGRGIDIVNVAYNLLDMTPMGRHEDDLPHTMSWVRRRDRYPPRGPGCRAHGGKMRRKCPDRRRRIRACPAKAGCIK